MKLKFLQIENYKSIDDTGEFKIDEITCLVGKNEAGKSAILQAINKLNPVNDEHGKFDPITEYPAKRRSLYNQQVKEGEIEPDNVITSKWELEDKDVETLEKSFGKGSLLDKEVTIKKGYNNTRYWAIKLDDEVILKHEIDDFGLSSSELKSVGKPKTLKELKAHLNGIEEPSDAITKFLKHIDNQFPDDSITKVVAEKLSPQLPKFLYFPDYEKMPGKVSIEDIAKRTEEKNINLPDEIFLALLRQAGTSIDDLKNVKKHEELVSKIEGAQNRISDQIFEYWSQNTHLQVRVEFAEGKPEDPPPFNSGHVVRTRIENKRHRASVDFDERSTGFVWFFSFLVWFDEVKRAYSKNLFLLLDEPGLSLHGKAQLDLLRYFNEKLRPYHQVLYSTHSPWMIDGDYPLSIRTVEDVVVPEKRDDRRNLITSEKLLGTKVGDRIWSSDPDTIFPMQAYAGWENSQFLFVGKHNLLVEGPSEILYINWFSKELKKQKREYLDERWILVPVEGIDKIFPFVSLFAGNKLDIAVLVDYTKGDKKKVRDLEEREALEDGRVFRADTYAEQEEADVEDILGRSLYIELVNLCYELSERDTLPKDKPEDAKNRVVKEVEDHMRLLPRYDEFNHYAPSAYLLSEGENIKEKLPDLDKALDRFEKLFTDINALLKK